MRLVSKPHMTVHRCPHRKVQLSTGWVEGDGNHAVRTFLADDLRA